MVPNMVPKVALCFLISGEHILNKEQIWREWIEPNKDFINVYFHYSELEKIGSPWIRNHAIPLKKTVRTSYFHVVPAYMALLSHAILHDTQNKWFCFLTESCAPIISPTKFKDLFEQYSEKSLLKWSKATWHASFNKRANLKYLSEEYRLRHEPWFSLTKIDALLCLRFVKEQRGMYLTICAGIIANESIFAIILKFYRRLKFALNYSTHVTVWTKMSSPTSPYVFRDASLQDTEYVRKEKEKNGFMMFMRKVDTTFQDEALRALLRD